MSSARLEGRSGSELVFASLRALMSAYQLWGSQSRCHLSELSELLNASEDWLWGVMAYLDAEGLVTLDRSAGTVSLTPMAAQKLLTRSLGSEEQAEPTSPQNRDVIKLQDRRRLTGTNLS
jgi:hypothetical protein